MMSNRMACPHLFLRVRMGEAERLCARFPGALLLRYPRSRVNISPSLDISLDPGSRFFLLEKHRCASRRLEETTNYRRFFLLGAPAALASESAIATACLRLLTLRPERPLLSVPRLNSRMTFSTFFAPRFRVLAFFRAIYPPYALPDEFWMS